MKKIALLLALTLLISVFSVTAAASDLGISMIGGDDAFQAQDFDNIQLNTVYEVPGFASFKATSFAYYDYFAQYTKDHAGDNQTTYDFNYLHQSVRQNDSSDWYLQTIWQDSGKNAEFVWLMMDITNLQKQDVRFGKITSVRVIYDDEYEYAGWVRQFNYDYMTDGCRPKKITPEDTSGWYIPNPESKNVLIALDPANEEAIGMVFTGTYAIGCTLPNAIVESERPLKMIITIGDCELTYIIRK